METTQVIQAGGGMMFYLILSRQKIKKVGKSEFHGVGGPLSVSDQRIQLPSEITR